MITKVLLIAFFVYLLQSVLAWLQIKRSYEVINQLKKQYQGKDYRLVSGTGRTKFFLIAKGYYTILVVDTGDKIIDYYGMEGYSTFATPKQRPEFIGMTLDEAERTFTKKNARNAFVAAREQLNMLREQALTGNA